MLTHSCADVWPAVLMCHCLLFPVPTAGLAAARALLCWIIHFFLFTCNWQAGEKGHAVKTKTLEVSFPFSAWAGGFRKAEPLVGLSLKCPLLWCPLPSVLSRNKSLLQKKFNLLALHSQSLLSDGSGSTAAVVRSSKWRSYGERRLGSFLLSFQFVSMALGTCPAVAQASLP